MVNNLRCMIKIQKIKYSINKNYPWNGNSEVSHKRNLKSLYIKIHLLLNLQIIKILIPDKRYLFQIINKWSIHLENSYMHQEIKNSMLMIFHKILKIKLTICKSQKWKYFWIYQRKNKIEKLRKWEGNNIMF